MVPGRVGVVAVAISGREQLLVHPSWWTSSPASVGGIAPEYADGVPKRLRYQEVLAKEQSHDRSGTLTGEGASPFRFRSWVQSNGRGTHLELLPDWRFSFGGRLGRLGFACALGLLHLARIG